jgi:poly-gamma-glutamate capsule biosynthesis protein CapA/YwtB (metallophosphatase superfamily)
MTLQQRSKAISVFLCGDVMTGRGIDQVLPYCNDPVLYEPGVRDAREYLWLAERVNGAIPRPVQPAYIWGDALSELERFGPDVRIVNLETSVTCSEDAWPNKGINYRMHPRNIGCLQAANIDCCCLANNHVLDWGYAGLAETLRTLDQAGIVHAGAGGSAAHAASPAVLNVADKGRVLVFSFGSTSSGVPPEWSATSRRPGVNLLPDLSEKTAHRLAMHLHRARRPGDIAIASIHWGSNWGYDVPDEQITFAHRLVDDGFDIVHGHSSHHVRPIELYRDRLILYGCGDFIDDYEGIGGYEPFRGDLKLMYLIDVDPQGRTERARLVPMRMIRFRLIRATEVDSTWLCGLLNTLGSCFRTCVELEDDGRLTVHTTTS